jgi:glycosyltransferase involved in cell wall biosynthesis
MNQRPLVSVVIPVAGAGVTLLDAIDSIRGQDYPGEIEMVVAAGDRGSAEAAAGNDVIVVSNPSGQTARGLNLAIERSSGDVIVRVDAHSIVPPSYVSDVVRLLLETRAENVGGMQVPEGRSFWERAIAAAMKSPVGAGDARYRIGGSAGPAETVYLGAFPRPTLDRLGGYDESYIRNQDYELNQRIRDTGGIVWFDPSLRVRYRPRPSLRALARQYFQYGQWKRVFARRHPTSLRARQVAPVVLVVTIVASFIAAIVWPVALLLPAAYLALLAGTAVASIPSTGLAAIGVAPALMVMHLAWGTGFLLGHEKATIG